MPDVKGYGYRWVYSRGVMVIHEIKRSQGKKSGGH